MTNGTDKNQKNTLKQSQMVKTDAYALSARFAIFKVQEFYDGRLREEDAAAYQTLTGNLRKSILPRKFNFFLVSVKKAQS